MLVEELKLKSSKYWNEYYGTWYSRNTHNTKEIQLFGSEIIERYWSNNENHKIANDSPLLNPEIFIEYGNDTFYDCLCSNDEKTLYCVDKANTAFWLRENFPHIWCRDEFPLFDSSKIQRRY